MLIDIMKSDQTYSEGEKLEWFNYFMLNKMNVKHQIIEEKGAQKPDDQKDQEIKEKKGGKGDED